MPCHRVVRTDRTVGGFSGALSGAFVEKKIRLLKDEGVLFETLPQPNDAGRENGDLSALVKVESDCIYTF